MSGASSCQLHHLAVGCHDVKRLAAFYREFFGLEECGRHVEPDGSLRSVWLDLGGAILMLERTAQPLRAVAGVGAGLFLVAFRVSPQRRSELERELEVRGHRIEGRTAFTSYVRDPEGNRIAFSHHPQG